MKTLGRIVLILMVTGIIAGAMVAVVNTNGTSNTDSFPGADEAEFRPQGFQPGQRPEGRERGGGGFGSWTGFVRNIAIIGGLVALVGIPRRLLAQRKAEREVLSPVENGQRKEEYKN